MHILDELVASIEAGKLSGNPVIHIGISSDVEHRIMTDARVYSSIETMDAKLFGIPYSIIDGEKKKKWVTLNLSDLQRA